MLKALIQNSTLLVVAYLMVTVLTRWDMLRNRTRNIFIQGMAYAACGILAMFFSVTFLPGVLIDMRAPVIVVASLTGGPAVGLVAILPMLGYRLYLGGTGMSAGIGIILTAYAFGILLGRFERKNAGYLFQLLAGSVSAVIYYIWIMTLPGGISGSVLIGTFIPLSVASILTISAIFFIRKREADHLTVLQTLEEMSDLFEEISLDENIGITVLNNTRIVYVNSSLLCKYGFNEFDPGNSDILSIVSPENRELITGYLQQIALGKNPGAVPMEISVPERGTLHFLVHARKLLYRGEDSVLVVSVDITKLLETERTLQSRIDQLRLALDASGAVLWKTDPSSDALQAEDDFFRLLSYSPDENPPFFSHFALASEMSAEMRLSFQELQNGTRSNIFGEIAFTGTDGLKRWFNTGARLTRVDRSGRPVEITGILYETTAIKESELDLKQKEIEDIQSQKMETIGRLAGGVAHDFNNLLHVIAGYAEMLGKTPGMDLLEEDLVEPILDAAARGKELVRQLLLFSRNKSPELKPLNLTKLSSGFLRLLARIIGENILVSSDIPQMPIMVTGDEGQIEQVLMNLCINSRDAMPEGGKIRISLRETEFSRSEKFLAGTIHPGFYAVLSVMDSGPGIPPDRQKLAFEPFYSTKQVDNGTGLGLPTVQGIMESHGGAILCETSPEGFFSVNLCFPMISCDDSGEDGFPGENSLERISLDSITVLLAEDDPQVGNLTAEGLRAEGINVLRTDNGQKAVDAFMASSEDIDILVFDVVMPVLSGPDAYRKIAAAGRNIPVIFTTGYAGDRLSLLPGKHRIIGKPYHISDLIRLIKEEIAGGKGDSR